ncbi:MAG: family 1 glycosylhydrolase [Rectinemataceae bacterium]
MKGAGSTAESPSLRFPEGFLWGAALASHQVEGGNTNNNWYRWEEAGRTAHRSGAACGCWSARWAEDLDRAAVAGQNAHRLSIDWSRIQPARDRWDDGALDRYRDILRGLRNRGMALMVSLHHFTDPLWLGELGGWDTQAVLPLFAEYTRRAVGALGDLCSLWCTINEPNIYAIEGYLRGNFPPGKRDIGLSFEVQANLARAHAAAYRIIHELQPKARVGYALHFRPQEPASRFNPLDRLASSLRFASK